MRSDVTLSTIVRVMERLLTKKQASKEDEEHQELLWNYEKAFTNKTSDFFVDIDSGNFSFMPYFRRQQFFNNMIQ